MEYNIPPFFSLVPSIFCWYIPFQMVDASIAMLAPWMFQLHAVHLGGNAELWWLGVSKKTGMKRDSLLEEPSHPKIPKLEEPIHPKKIPKQKHLMCNLLIFVSLPKFLSDTWLRCLIWEQHLSGVRNLPAWKQGSSFDGNFFCLQTELGPVAIIFHELYPPL